MTSRSLARQVTYPAMRENGVVPGQMVSDAPDLRVGIDAHMVGEQETGNETYIINLIRSLSQFDNHTNYFLYSPHPESLEVCQPLTERFYIRTVPTNAAPTRILWGLPREAARDQVDVLHVTYVAPPKTSIPIVATVHDISYALFPETFSMRDKMILGTLVPRTLKKADAIITVSESSRKDIVERYGTPAEKIAVCYQPISAQHRQLADSAAVALAQATYGIAGRYVLAVGNLQPRKNLPRLIRAFASVKRAGLYDGKLVLVGRSKWRESAIYDEVRELGLDDDVIFTGYVPEEDLVALYNAADVFVYPSLYEGYGLPPLEAMACGCPVVTGNTSSLPEVVGDAGIMVDPLSEDALADAIARLVGSPELRRELSQRGLQRVQRFTAEEAARVTMDVYQRVAMQHRTVPAANS